MSHGCGFQVYSPGCIAVTSHYRHALARYNRSPRDSNTFACSSVVAVLLACIHCLPVACPWGSIACSLPVCVNSVCYIVLLLAGTLRLYINTQNARGQEENENGSLFRLCLSIQEFSIRLAKFYGFAGSWGSSQHSVTQCSQYSLSISNTIRMCVFVCIYIYMCMCMCVCARWSSGWPCAPLGLACVARVRA